MAKRSAPFQVFQLFSRYAQRKLRDKGSLTIQLMQAPVIAFILGMLFWQEGYVMETQEPITAIRHEGILNLLQLNNGIHATLFLISAAAFWFGCSNVAREIVSERAIFLRELRTGLRPIALSSIFMYQFLLAAVQTLLLATIVWFSVIITASLLTAGSFCCWSQPVDCPWIVCVHVF